MFRAVGDPELARSHGLFVAEGRLVVRRGLEDSRYPVRSLLLNDAAHRDLSPPLHRVDGECPVLQCDTEAFARITGYNIHRGCLALVERPRPLSVAEAIAGARTLLVLDDVANPDNIGGIFRNAAAFGARVLMS